jgi:hypothetical protein
MTLNGRAFKPQLEPNARRCDPVLDEVISGLKRYLSAENVSQVDELHKNIAIFA